MSRRYENSTPKQYKKKGRKEKVSVEKVRITGDNVKVILRGFR